MTKIAVAFIALGITDSIYRILIDVAKEAKGAVMVLADFPNTHRCEPRQRRLIEPGRAETVSAGRSRLLLEGIDPDLIFPPEAKPDHADRG